MGLGGISIWQLLIILVIILLIFGTKKLRNIGSDLGGAVKGFKDSMKDEKDGDKGEQEGSQKTPEQLSKDQQLNTEQSEARDKSDEPRG